MRPFIKICGLCSAQDVTAVAKLKPDAIGFILTARSKRRVSPEDVRTWTERLPAGIKKVGVFLDASLAEIVRAVQTAGLDIVQLHGHEPPELCDLLPFTVWKRVYPGIEAPELIASYRVDALLVDSYSADTSGGTGRLSDWEGARQLTRAGQTPLVLAGGLAPDNVAQALREVRPWGVDVCSGVESLPRKKDLKLVKAFIAQCRTS